MSQIDSNEILDKLGIAEKFAGEFGKALETLRLAAEHYMRSPYGQCTPARDALTGAEPREVGAYRNALREAMRLAPCGPQPTTDRVHAVLTTVEAVRVNETMSILEQSVLARIEGWRERMKQEAPVPPARPAGILVEGWPVRREVARAAVDR